MQDTVTALARAVFVPLVQLPIITQVLLVIVAVILWPLLSLIWATLRWLRDVVRPTSAPEALKIIPSGEAYILLNKWDAKWIHGVSSDNPLQSKASTLLIKSGRKRVRGTVRYSQASDLKDGAVLALPDAMIAKLGLPPEGETIKASVRITRRFPLAVLWNNADASVRVGFKTAIWIAAVQIALSFGQPLLQGYFTPR